MADVRTLLQILDQNAYVRLVSGKGGLGSAVYTAGEILKKNNRLLSFTIPENGISIQEEVADSVVASDSRVRNENFQKMELITFINIVTR